MSSVLPEISPADVPVDGGQGSDAAEGLTLIKAFMQIKSAELRRSILDFVEKAAAAEG